MGQDLWRLVTFEDKFLCRFFFAIHAVRENQLSRVYLSGATFPSADIDLYWHCSSLLNYLHHLALGSGVQSLLSSQFGRLITRCLSIVSGVQSLLSSQFGRLITRCLSIVWCHYCSWLWWPITPLMPWYFKCSRSFWIIYHRQHQLTEPTRNNFIYLFSEQFFHLTPHLIRDHHKANLTDSIFDSYTITNFSPWHFFMTEWNLGGICWTEFSFFHISINYW